jgi:hypothetical protein
VVCNGVLLDSVISSKVVPQRENCVLLLWEYRIKSRTFCFRLCPDIHVKSSYWKIILPTQSISFNMCHCFNKKNFCIMPTKCVCGSFIDSFCVDILFFVMDRVHVLCEVGNKVLYIGEVDLSFKV